MPFQNRVTPGGDLIAVVGRGMLTGNRGVLHDASGEIVRRYQVRRWITCLTVFGDRHRVVMAPNRYTHLFFLDEATALAAGHRPCGECRREDYQRFRRCWADAHGLANPPSAEAMDQVLHRERALLDGDRQTHPGEAAALPDGTFVQWREGAWLVRAGTLLRWTPEGYAERCALPSGTLPVLTPPTTTAVIRAGFRPVLHPTAAPH